MLGNWCEKSALSHVWKTFRCCGQVVVIKVFGMGCPFSGSGSHFGPLLSFREKETSSLGRSPVPRVRQQSFVTLKF